MALSALLCVITLELVPTNNMYVKVICMFAVLIVAGIITEWVSQKRKR
jgi:hypothetical protein